MRFILALLLLTLPALGQTISYPSSGGSVSSSTTTNEFQHITNSTFSSGIGGWYDASPNGVVFSHFSNVSVQAIKLENVSENNGAFLAHDYTPISSSKTGKLVGAYWFTNSDDRSVKARIWNRVDDVDSIQSLANNGAGVTTIFEKIFVNQYFNGTSLWLEIAGGAGAPAGSIFFDYIVVTSAWEGVSITTNQSAGSPNISIGKTALGVTR